MIDKNTTLDEAIHHLEEKDNTGTLSEEWQRILKWLYELSDCREQHRINRELADDERWN